MESYRTYYGRKSLNWMEFRNKGLNSLRQRNKEGRKVIATELKQ